MKQNNNCNSENEEPQPQQQQQQHLGQTEQKNNTQAPNTHPKTAFAENKQNNSNKNRAKVLTKKRDSLPTI